MKEVIEHLTHLQKILNQKKLRIHSCEFPDLTIESLIQNRQIEIIKLELAFRVVDKNPFHEAEILNNFKNGILKLKCRIEEIKIPDFEA